MKVLQTHHGERFIDPVPDLPPPLAPQLQGQMHVVEDRGPRHQGWLLEDEADIAHMPALRPDQPPRGDAAEPGDDPECRALAAAGGPEQAEELVARDPQIEVLERHRPVREGFRDPLELEDPAGRPRQLPLASRSGHPPVSSFLSSSPTPLLTKSSV